MNEPVELEQLAYKSERAAGRRLALARGLSGDQALRQVLAQAAGMAGLDVLVASRLALRAAQDQRDAAREAIRAARAEAQRAQRAAVHDGHPTAWRAWFDGSARPNPGRCGIGAVLRGPGGAGVELSQPAGYGNSSEAEYRALIAVLEAAVAHGADELTVYGDSRVVIDDLSGPDAFAAPSLSAYRARAHVLAARIDSLTLRWVPRHKNLEADALSQRATERTVENTDA